MPNFIRDSSNIPKSRKIMIHFQENAQTNRKTDKRMDRSYLGGPMKLPITYINGNMNNNSCYPIYKNRQAY